MALVMSDPFLDALPGEQIEAFLASLRRCLAVPAFLEDFYAAFVGSSDEVRAKFAHTDFARQARMLADSLFVIAVALQGREDSPARVDLPRLAERHGRHQLDVRPEHYDAWLACLLSAARATDPQFTSTLEDAWRATLGAGIAYMRSRY